MCANICNVNMYRYKYMKYITQRFQHYHFKYIDVSFLITTAILDTTIKKPFCMSIKNILHSPLCALLLTRFHSISEETLQQQHLLDDDPHLPGGCQRLHWHDHLQAKVFGADLWPISLQGHFPHRYRPIVTDPDLLGVYCTL